ncbi:protein LONGIFOLIA 1 [Coffea arabica]|uniref:Protein LONGIFOLIA 1 n=1 Tax=Coffea arabica TaxID=13443 RepID=A0A6P6T4Z6_COFAR|nr:protein LONGIFOLIA 1-like [Coffea arabica]
MSAKILPRSKDENRDLQKQIGCMNGIFQLFDRHYFLAGRRSAAHHHKRLLPGDSSGGEAKNATEKTTGSKLEVVQDQPRVSTESLGTSFSSSSCSSTFSSLDHSRTLQCRPPSFTQNNLLESTNEIPVKRQSSSLHFSQQSPDIRDVVKDSMQREHRRISIKTAAREDGRGRTLKHIDSPRPFQQPKTVQPRVAEFDSRSLAKLQDSPCICKEESDASLRQERKEPPRFSYDERETRNRLKSATKLKELPRLSLDSRQSSLSSASEPRLNFLLRELRKGENVIASKIVDAYQVPGSNKRASGVVAKLMGLEAFPDSVSNNEGETIKDNSCHDKDFFTKSSKESDKCKKNPLRIQQMVHKDPASPVSKNGSLGIQPTSSPRFPLETASWRQPNAINDSPRTGPGSWNSYRDTPRTSSSVYGEIEKRISELEFRKSGKDLRALKQILEAMQNTRMRLDNKEGEQADLRSETSRYSSDYSCCSDLDSTAFKCQSNKIDHLASKKVTSSPKRFNSSILITKPARTMGDGRISGTSVVPADAPHLPNLRTRETLYTRKDSVCKLAAKDLTPKKTTPQNPHHCKSCTDKKINSKIPKVVQTTRAPQLAKVENYVAFGRSSGSVSPRFQQKNHGIVTQPHLTTPSPELEKRRGKLIEPDSSSKLRPKSTLHRRKDRISCTTGNKEFSHQGDTASIPSESTSSLASQTDTEITSTGSSTEIRTRRKADQKERNGAASLGEDMPLAELIIVPTEQPSPVSVLDATFCREDSLSPVKKISTVFQDYRTPDPDEAEWHYLGDGFNQKKLENLKQLLHKLRLLNTVPDEASTFEFDSLSERPSPDHRYITKILLASGLLEDICTVSTDIQLHSSGYLINPDLFHVLEQTEENTMSANEEHRRSNAPLKLDQKIHRKLVFDIVNEILIRKLAPESSFMQRKRNGTGKELLRELYSEVDHIQAKTDCSLDNADETTCILYMDMMQQRDDWADYPSLIPAVVLDMERLIFKDLITEVITAQALGQCDWTGRQCKTIY